MAKKRALGKGIGALLNKNVEKIKQAEQPSEKKLDTLPVEQLRKGKYQPRTQFSEESLQELAESIKAQGLVQPVVVRKVADDYEIVAGERRWRAAQMAGLHEIPIVVREIDDVTTAAFSIIENIQREDLNPLEEAIALQRFVQDFDMTHQEIGSMIGRSRASVSNLLRLLDLAEPVKALLNESRIEMGHARSMLSLKEADQISLATEIVKKGLSVRETEKKVRQLLQGKPQNKTEKTQNKDPNTKAIEARLSEKMCTKVDLQTSANGKGKLVIHYNNLDELEGILQHIEG